MLFKNKRNDKFLVIIILLLITIMASLSLTATASAQEIDRDYIHCDDGTYIIVTLTIEENPTISTFGSYQTRTATKTFYKYDPQDRAIGTMSLTGTFRYDGTSAKATSSSIIAAGRNGWALIAKSSSKSGATVSGKASFRKSGDIQMLPGTMTCSKTGVVK